MFQRPVGKGYLHGGASIRLKPSQTLKVDPSERVALRPGGKYVLSGSMTGDGALLIRLEQGTLGEPVRAKKKGEWQNFQFTFNTAADQWWLRELSMRNDEGGEILVRDLSLKENGGGPELLWEADVQRLPRGSYNQSDSFMLDRLVDAAERSGIYLQLCLLTRDLYMADLSDPNSDKYAAAEHDAQEFMRYAVARWGYSTHVFAWEYFNEIDPKAPTGRFYSELGEYLKRVDPYQHLRTTSAWGPAPEQWKHAQVDIADLHWYLRPSSKPDWRDEISAALDRAQFLRATATNKPALLGEFGLADDKWGRSPHMAQDKGNIHFHNALWASALSGLSGAASFWWWEVLDQNNAYGEYQPLAKFLAQVPFTSKPLTPFSLNALEKPCRAIGLKSDDAAYGWLVSNEATWWKVVGEKRELPQVTGATISLPIQDGAYRVKWIDTRNGTVVAESSVKAQGALKLEAPSFTADIAVIASREN